MTSKMKTIEYGDKIDGRICLALGFFDGVHIGHRKILELVTIRANAISALKVVSTFADSPNKTYSLMSYHDRKSIFAYLGMDYCLTLYYLRERLKTGTEFFSELISHYDVAEIVCGSDYKFGSDFLDTAKLSELCEANGIRLNIVPMLSKDGVRVSSTAIKTLLKSGKLKTANKMLGEPYRMSGRIIAGKGIGKKIGMPTVNIKLPYDALNIKNGVYGTKITIDGKEYFSVTNFGSQPTFGFSALMIETHIIDFNSDSLEGSDISLKFIEYLRPIRKFDNAESLVEQIREDISWYKSELNKGDNYA